MAGDESLYSGSNYGMDPGFPGSFSEYSSDLSDPYAASAISVATDARTANQLKQVSDKLSTGAKAIEVSGVTPAELETMPKQHFDEIRRLKKLTGSELTFHGPIVEASGITQQGWTEAGRTQAERQMFNAVEKARQLGETGENIIVTFHSAAGLPEMTDREMTKDGEVVTGMHVYNEREGQFNVIKPRENFLLKDEEKDVNKELNKTNKDAWSRELTHLSFNAHAGADPIKDLMAEKRIKIDEDSETAIKIDGFADVVTESKKPEWHEFMQRQNPEVQKELKKIVSNVDYGEIYLRDAYNELQNMFNKAWVAANKEKNTKDIERLDSFRNEVSQTVSEKDLDNPKNLLEVERIVSKGVNVLNSLSETPKSFRPLNEFATDKSSETFGNLAFDSYKKFKDSAPIISIENPPAGSGLSRGSDLKELVDKSRDHFVKKAVDSGLSKSQAEKQAEKLIGVTWDVGHINMLRKYGYKSEDIVKETKEIAPALKHIHLSDNFGLEHTELPMGMGNVPFKKHIAELKKQHGDKLKKIKQVIEAGTWYKDFKSTPMAETLRAFGSPIYAMQMAPSWNQASGVGGVPGYFAGYGMNPDIHHTTYGAGFSNIPVELGGQMPGGQSRLSGAPIE